MNEKIKEYYKSILLNELVPAMGCTEPIAIAYAAAKAREILGKMPNSIIVKCSGNIIKNVMGVVVPASDGMKGIDTSAVLGSIIGESHLKLEVLNAATSEDILRTKALINAGICSVELMEGVSNLNIIVESRYDDEYAIVEISHTHTNIVRVEKNGTSVYENGDNIIDRIHSKKNSYQMSIKDIWEYSNTLEVPEIEKVISQQIDYNTRIAYEGLNNTYGVNIGSTLVKNFGSNVNVLAKALPAAGSDARMSGCALPVVINSGSGNQGMTVSLPVVVFSEHLKCSKEKLYRALVLSNLISVYLKAYIGKLSAFCGAVTAACGSGAGIAYLKDGNLDVICKTITNTLGNVSGIVCDGAKPSCAAKIASAVDAAIIAHYLALEGNVFEPGEGLISSDIEKTIMNFGRLGKVGMRFTDIEVLNIMIGN